MTNFFDGLLDSNLQAFKAAKFVPQHESRKSTILAAKPYDWGDEQVLGKPYDWGEELSREALHYATMIGDMVTPYQAKLIGVPDEEIARQLTVS